MDNVCGAVVALRTFDGMTEIEVSPEEVAALGASLVDVAGVLGDLDLMAPEAGWLPGGVVADAFGEVVTSWQRRRVQLEQSLGELGTAAAAAGAVYLDAEDRTVRSLRRGDSR